MKPAELKIIVKEKYGEIAVNSIVNKGSSCCGSDNCGSVSDYSKMSESYDTLKGYNRDADMGLGCGIPTAFAQIKAGDTIVDLGSGAGNDCFVARALVGETGRVVGVDMTETMIEKANANNLKAGFKNIEFRLGDIEDLPVDNNFADVVISNCVLNLVPDKNKTFSEIFRVLKPGGHLSVSDIVLRGELPMKIRNAAEMYAGCVSGALQIETYLKAISESGFVNTKIQKERIISLPDKLLLQFLDQEELTAYKKSDTGIFSITVYAEKGI
jgi:ubiquinone/menaquinone biosynthesis C-methylase UbiE